MKRILSLLSLLLTLCCGLTVNAQTPAALESAAALLQVRQVEITAYTFDKKGRYVEHDHLYGDVFNPTSVQDVIYQIRMLDSLRFKLKNPGATEVFIEAVLSDESGWALFQSDTSFMAEKNGKNYEIPWHATELHFTSYPGWSYGVYPIDDKKKFVAPGKPINVELTFDWITFADIREVQPDNHGFVDCWLSPEWDNNPAIETSIHDDGEVQLWARSAYGFKPESVYVFELQSDGEGVVIELEYVDEMILTGNPGDQLIIFFDFDMDLPSYDGGKG